MTEDSLFAALPELRQEVRQLREQHALIAERVAKLEAVIVAIEALHAPAKPLGPKAATLAQPAVPAAQLKGIPAVRRVMRELPGASGGQESFTTSWSGVGGFHRTRSIPQPEQRAP